MVCHFEGGDILKPKVIGLFLGEQTNEPYNICLTFTSAGIDWITQVIGATSQLTS